MASVAAEATAISDVTFTPSVDTTIRISSSVKIARTELRVKTRSDWSTLRRSIATSTNRIRRRRTQRPI